MSDQEADEIPTETEPAAGDLDESDQHQHTESQEVEPSDLMAGGQRDANVQRHKQVTKLLQLQSPLKVKSVEERGGRTVKKSNSVDGGVMHWLKLT